MTALPSTFPTFDAWLGQHLGDDGPIGSLAEAGEHFVGVRFLSDAVEALTAISAPPGDFTAVRDAWRLFEAERSRALSSNVQPLPETLVPACTCRSVLPGAFVVESEGCPVHDRPTSSPSSTPRAEDAMDPSHAMERRRGP